MAAMRPHSATICATLLCFLIMSATPSRAPERGCKLRSGLRREVLLKYPGSTVVNREDLSAYDEQLFERDHTKSCPGLVQVDFYGDRKPTWAIVLLRQSNKKADLVLAQYSGNWKFQLLDSADAAPVPVVWREKPGKYEDVYGRKTLSATRSAVVFCGYESWSIVYAWTGRKVEKIRTSD
jgi:hypothetical protein